MPDTDGVLQRLARTWYEPGHPVGLLLAPLGALVGMAARARLRLYRAGLLRAESVDATVVVVGNLTAGGTGKTPLVTWLVEQLLAAGRRPGVATRGYPVLRGDELVVVTPDADAARVGDEPLLLARRTGAPVVAAPDRVRAARLLVRDFGCDVVVCDDGLQHLRLRRDVEIVVVDGVRGFGNGRCLPAGPLREPARRLAEVDLVVQNGGAGRDDRALMRLVAGQARSLADDRRSQPLTGFAGQRVHAVAGIGHPDRFFALLAEAGLAVVPHPFPDHHAFSGDDLRFDDSLPVLMTEKDAVKCRAFAAPGTWFVPVSATLAPHVARRVLELIDESRHGPQAA